MTTNVLPIVRVNRQLPSWIGGFLEYTENIWSTDSYRLWAGIVAIAGALERKVWIRSQGSSIYPNLFVFLVGPPGAGKTRAVSICADLWSALKEHHIAAVSLSKASLMDAVGAAKRVVSHPIEMNFNSLLIASKELGALIPTYDPDFLNALTYLYDNEKYDEERRGRPEPLIIESPLINLIGCTTPSYLLDTMPSAAWDQGFLARVVIVYDSIVGQREISLAEESSEDTALKKALMEDIKLIGQMAGKMVFSKEAGTVLKSWYANPDIAPAHPRLTHYNTRRPIHLFKLCMIACADRGDDLTISLEDVQAAIDWLSRAEAKMPDLFLAMASGGDSQVISDCWHWAYATWIRQNRPITAAQLWTFLQGKIPSYSIQKVIETMIRSNQLKAEVVEGIATFRPVPPSGSVT